MIVLNVGARSQFVSVCIEVDRLDDLRSRGLNKTDLKQYLNSEQNGTKLDTLNAFCLTLSREATTITLYFLLYNISSLFYIHFPHPSMDQMGVLFLFVFPFRPTVFIAG